MTFLLMTAASAALVFAINACGDDDDNATNRSTASSEAGPNTPINQNPNIPPYTPPPAPPPDLVDRSGVLGNATLVADIGQPIDGPSWSVTENALYFTVPGQTPTLRRLVADGGVETVLSYDGGTPGPYGTASGGGSKIFVTEPAAIATLAPDGDGGVTFNRRPGTFDLLGDIAATTEWSSDAGGPLAFFVDTSAPKAYRYDPSQAAGADLVRVLDGTQPDSSLAPRVDGGPTLRATGIAIGRDDLSRETVYVALSTGATGTVVRVQKNFQGVYEDEAYIPLTGTPPNGIAVDEQGYLYVAWAMGIDVYRNDKPIVSPSIPIAAAPTSLAFGGADRKTLYVVTAKGKIYAIPSSRTGVLR